MELLISWVRNVFGFRTDKYYHPAYYCRDAAMRPGSKGGTAVVSPNWYLDVRIYILDVYRLRLPPNTSSSSKKKTRDFLGLVALWFWSVDLLGFSPLTCLTILEDERICCVSTNNLIECEFDALISTRTMHRVCFFQLMIIIILFIIIEIQYISMLALLRRSIRARMRSCNMCF